ncbi:MAG: pepN, partial [Ramlibacter sp.]|nr:pepN [Ramlibacter sp.]
MREGQSSVIHRADYQAPAFWIDTVELCFDLDPAKTRVLNKMKLRRNTDVAQQPLRLDGEELNLSRVLVNGQGTSFKIEGSQLVLENLPEGDQPFELEIFTTCAPSKNTKLMGLYVSNESFFTQCEAEGFRRITYFLDRPDNLAVFKVRMTAPLAVAPVLLANGNLVDKGDAGDGMHYAVWEDPFPKPAYLFALVAGDLGSISDSFTTGSGRKVELGIYCTHGKEEQCLWAMDSLKRSMAWDERRFGLEYDL